MSVANRFPLRFEHRKRASSPAILAGAWAAKRWWGRRLLSLLNFRAALASIKRRRRRLVRPRLMESPPPVLDGDQRRAREQVLGVEGMAIFGRVETGLG